MRVLVEFWSFLPWNNPTTSSSWNLGSSFMTLVLLALLVVVVRSVLRQLFALYSNQPWHAQMPSGWWPIIGHFHHTQGTIAGMPAAMTRWANECNTSCKNNNSSNGCFEVDLMGRRMIVVAREDRALELFAGRPHKVIRNRHLAAAVNSTGAKGVFAAEGVQWQQERKLVAATMNKWHMQDYVPVLVETAVALVDKWTEDANDEGILYTVKKDVGSAAADSVAKIFVGVDLDFLHNPNSSLAVNIFRGFNGVWLRAIAPAQYWTIPYIGQDLDGFGKYYRYGQSKLDAFVETFEVQRAADQRKHSKEDDNEPKSKTFLAKLYDHMERENSRLTRERVVGNIFTAFAAGIDTTGLALMTTLYVLTQDQPLQQELSDHVIGFDLEKATLQDFYTKVPLLKSFFHEIHRYYSFPMMQLETKEAIPFCGTTLPAHSNLLVAIRHIMIQKEHPPADTPKGPDHAPAHQFSYCRYLVPAAAEAATDDGEKTTTNGSGNNNIHNTHNDNNVTDSGSPNNGRFHPNDWQCTNPSTKHASFLAFGHGVRSCPGRSYSEILSYAVLIRLLQTFHIDLAPHHPPVTITGNTLMAPDRDLHLQLTPRSSHTQRKESKQ